MTKGICTVSVRKPSVASNNMNADTLIILYKGNN